MPYRIYRTRILTDIANAIRRKGGTTALLRPDEMAAAVTALDGTIAGTPRIEPYKDKDRGLLSSEIFDDIARAVRGKNGSSKNYEPSELAAAITALRFDVRSRLQGILLTDGTFEVTTRGEARSSTASVSHTFAMSPDGYSAYKDRPWNGSTGSVIRIVIDGSVASAAISSIAYWFYGFKAATEVVGFQNLQGFADGSYAFYGCSALETIYATSFDNSAVTTDKSMLSGCYRLMGYGGTVYSYHAKEQLVVGEKGILTDPGNDTRVWFHGYLYSDGELVLTTDTQTDSSRTLTASGRVCATGAYYTTGCMPWSQNAQAVTSVRIDASMAAIKRINCNMWLSGCANLTGVYGLSNLRGVRDMNYTFNGCSSLRTLDLRGFDPADLHELDYTFSRCTSLVTILVDATWTLPGTVSGANTFYKCDAIKGGRGTIVGDNIGPSMMSVDREGREGFLTGA